METGLMWMAVVSLCKLSDGRIMYKRGPIEREVLCLHIVSSDPLDYLKSYRTADCFRQVVN